MILTKVKISFSKNRIVFILVLFSMTLFFSTFTLTVYYPGHLWMLYPFIQIIISVAIFEAWKFTTRRLAKLLFVLFLAAFLLLNALKCVEGFSDLIKEKQRIAHCSVLQLSDWLLSNKIKKMVGFDLPTNCGVRFFSKLQVNTNFSDFKFNLSYVDELVKGAVPGEVFVVDYKNLIRFQALLKALNKKAYILKQFNFTNGLPRFVVYVLE